MYPARRGHSAGRVGGFLVMQPGVQRRWQSGPPGRGASGAGVHCAMSSLRFWLGDPMRPWLVALVALASVVAALIVASVGAGLGGLGPLGQIVSGPAPPHVAPAPGAAAGRSARARR